MNAETTPLVTVVVPAFNAERLIGVTIESVVAQSFTDWEMLVVDDCSSDRTSEVVDKWSRKDERIRLISLPRNFGGPAGPRNEGVRQARGRYVAFLDSDDIWHPEKLHLQIQVLQNNNVDFVCSKMSDFSDESEISFCKADSFSLKSINFSQESYRNRIPSSSVIASTELLRRYPFNQDLRYRAVEDYHCWLRLLEGGACCLKLQLPLLHYRKIEGQISGSKISMVRKVFMVHREYPGRKIVSSFLMTIGHVVGAVYVRLIQKKM